jgi:uncharacterized protein (TIGR02231 family)
MKNLIKRQSSFRMLHIFGTIFYIFIFGLTNSEASQQAQHISAGDIKKVRLYKGRAEIFRQVSVQIPVGSSDFKLGPIPTTLINDSLRVSPEKGSPIKISNFSIQKTYETQFLNPSIQKQEEKVQQFSMRLNSIKDELTTLNDQLKYIENISVGKVQAKTLPGPEYWDSVLKFKANRGKTLRDKYRETFEKSQIAEKELKAEEKTLEDMKKGTKKEANYIDIKLRSKNNSKFNLNISYQIRNAGWKPTYRLRTDTRKKLIAFEYMAKITQRTGEDWEGISLELTTSQPSRGTTPPKLHPWVLDYPQPPIKLFATEQSFSQPGAKPSPNKRGLRQQDAIAMSTKVIQSGISLTYQIPQEQTIASGTSNFNTLIFSEDFDAKLVYTTIPKNIQNVFLTAKTKNTSPFQLLYGPIKNFVDGSFVGNSWLKDTAPGQKIELGLGLDDSFEVKRKLIKKEGGDGGIFNQVQTQRYIFEISVKNFKDQSVKIEVKDQLPLPYQEEIKVRTNQISPEPDTKDKQNFLTWHLNLKPKERKTITLDFQVDYPEGKTVKGL